MLAELERCSILGCLFIASNWDVVDEKLFQAAGDMCGGAAGRAPIYSPLANSSPNKSSPVMSHAAFQSLSCASSRKIVVIHLN